MARSAVADRATDAPRRTRAPAAATTPSGTRALAGVVLALGAACTNASTDPAGGAGSPDPLPAPNAWRAVDSIIDATVAAGVLDDFVVQVWNRDDSLVYARTVGDFDSARRVPVASASKLIAGLVLLDLVADGTLALETTTADLLDWTGPAGRITLRQLLSFTSGLDPNHPCTLNPFTTLGACVDRIADAPRRAEPATRYDYGSTHLHVAARMAEVATGASWNELFRDRVRGPLGLPDAVRFVTLPRQDVGVDNPLVAGGLWASVDEYAAMLRLAFDGAADGVRIASPALLTAIGREPFPDVVIGNSPYAGAAGGARYGLTAWLECETPATGCGRVSSPGAFGFTPWLDREAGHYGIVGMFNVSAARPAQDATVLARAIGPFVESAVAAP